MKFLIITLLFYCQRHITKYTILSPEKSNTYSTAKKKSSGLDERYLPVNETETQTQLYNIRQNFEKKKMLGILQNENVIIEDKLALLRDNSIKSPNIRAGGLINEFE